jgi:hypothetical protein
MLDAGPLNFGGIPVGQTNAKPLVIRNTGGVAVTLFLTGMTLVSGDGVDGGLAFALQGTQPEVVALQPNDSYTVSVAFAPQQAGLSAAAISIPTDDQITPTFSVTCCGYGLLPDGGNNGIIVSDGGCRCGLLALEDGGMAFFWADGGC